MNQLGVARRYARSLHEVAAQQGILDRLDDDIDFLETSFDASRDLTRLFESPIISREKKQNVVKALFEERVSPTMLSFVDLLIRKQRERVFVDIVRVYREMRDAELGIVEAMVRLPAEPTESEREAISNALSRRTGKSVRLRVEIDPELIGGAVIQLGDTVYDGSVRNKLASLKSQLVHGSITTN